MPDIPAITQNLIRKTKNDGLYAALKRSLAILNDGFHGRHETSSLRLHKLSRFVDVLQTARERDWDAISDEVVMLYD